MSDTNNNNIKLTIGTLVEIGDSQWKIKDIHYIYGALDGVSRVQIEMIRPDVPLDHKHKYKEIPGIFLKCSCGALRRKEYMELKE